MLGPHIVIGINKRRLMELKVVFMVNSGNNR